MPGRFSPAWAGPRRRKRGCSSFVGLVAAGQMFVIRVGGIDLSVPWVLNAAAILTGFGRRTYATGET